MCKKKRKKYFMKTFVNWCQDFVLVCFKFFSETFIIIGFLKGNPVNQVFKFYFNIILIVWWHICLYCSLAFFFFLISFLSFFFFSPSYLIIGLCDRSGCERQKFSKINIGHTIWTCYLINYN